jgi:hypothetical protein
VVVRVVVRSCQQIKLVARQAGKLCRHVLEVDRGNAVQRLAAPACKEVRRQNRRGRGSGRLGGTVVAIAASSLAGSASRPTLIIVRVKPVTVAARAHEIRVRGERAEQAGRAAAAATVEVLLVEWKRVVQMVATRSPVSSYYSRLANWGRRAAAAINGRLISAG